MATKTKAELELEIIELKKKLAEKESAPVSEPEEVVEPKTVPTPVYMTAPSTDVVLVYTSHSLGHLEGKMFAIDATIYGEEFTLSRQQFDELVGKYRSWFDAGILAVSYRNVDVAAAKGLPTDKDIDVSVKELKSLGTMSNEQIEKIWSRISKESTKDSIITYYKDKFMEDAPGYRDRARVDCMNRLTDGAFADEVLVASGRQVRYSAIDLMQATEEDK